jgi:Protein of unknown function (DUF2585)
MPPPTIASSRPTPFAGIDWRHLLAVAVLLVLQGGVLLAMGRVPWCSCGYVKLWHGVVDSAENSQHLTDWYSLTHLVHGLLFYLALWLVGRHWPLGLRLVLTVALEAGWEVLENTDFVIERYRAATISLHYYGDSVVNSMADTLACVLGFMLAARLPVWAAVTLGLALELVAALVIRDNLTLNVVMLLYPFAAIRQWQAGA